MICDCDNDEIYNKFMDYSVLNVIIIIILCSPPSAHVKYKCKL